MTFFTPANDARLQYMGRIDFQNPAAPSFAWAGSTITLRFRGSGLVCFFDDLGDWWAENGNAIGIALDDQPFRQITLRKGVRDQSINLTGLLDGEHSLTLIKQLGPGAGCGTLVFRGLELAPLTTLLLPPPRPTIKIEIYGDSITEGGGAACMPGQNDLPETNSAWHSYANVFARLLNADLHNLGIGGLAVCDGMGYYNAAQTGLETTFNRLRPYNDLPRWDLRQFSPHLVILAMGVNDASTNAFSNLKVWRDTYRSVISELQSVHGPATRFLLTVGPIAGACDLALPYVQALASEVDADFYQFTFRANGHPNQAESEQMACELAAFLYPKLERFTR